jgi:hypothetical protein
MRTHRQQMRSPMIHKRTPEVEVLSVVFRSIATLAVVVALTIVVVPTVLGQIPTEKQQNGASAKSTRQKALSSSSGSSLFLPVVTYYPGGSQASMVAVADVNGDGRPDLIVLNCGNCYGPSSITNPGSVDIMLGNGDGTFQPAVSYGTGTSRPRFVVVADVNGDGKLDLVVANRCIDNGCLVEAVVAVLLGNGDGKFQAAVTYNSGGLFTSSVAVADVNGDGKPDLVVGNWCADPNCDGSVGVLLGNGDGTFQAVVTYPTGGFYAFAVAVADVNGDGKLDALVITKVAVCKGTSCDYVSSVGVLLGNGDGTFQKAVTYLSGGLSFPPFSSLLTVADVNGDGRPDLIVENSQCCGSSDSVLGVLLGNGDGTFRQVVTYKSGAGGWGTSVAVADMNGDGKLDVVATDQCASANCINKGLVALLLGNGDGTFQAAQTYDSGGFLTNSVTIADLNGDGNPDLVVANICADDTTSCKRSSVGVLLNNSASRKVTTTTTLSSSLNPSFVGQLVTFKATVTSAAGIPPNGETVTFKNGSAVLGTASLTGGGAILTTSSLPAGSFTITATYSGDSTFAASTSPGLKQVVNPTNKFATSTLLISSLNPSIYGQAVTWTATVRSSGSITPTGTVKFTWGYTIGSATLNTSGVATLTKSNLNADPYPLTAVYSGDASDLGSTSAVLNQVVLETTSSATLSSSPNPSTHGQAVTLTAKITSPTLTPTGQVTFTAGKTALGTAQLSGGAAKLTISSLAVGSTKVTATYYGDSNIAKSSASIVQTVR